MQTIMKAVLLSLFAANAMTSAVTPVQKVIQMLTDMKAKGQQEVQAEQKIYADYSKYVRTQSRELDYEIKTAKATVEKLIAVITKADSDVASLKKKISANDAETATLEADLQAATAQRAAAKDKFLGEQTDYSESLFALDKAIEMLKSQTDQPQAMMLLQRMSKTMSGMRRVLASLAMAQSNSGAPAVAAYENQSGGIVEMLAGLKDNFRKELADLEKEEANSSHAFDMEKVHLTNTLDNLKAEREELSQTKAKTSADSARAKGELADTKASLAEAEKFLADVKATYATKTAAFEGNQKVRASELEALGKAIEIISDPTVSASKRTALVQKKLSLLQMHSASKRQAQRSEATAFLKEQAAALNSKTLAKLAVTLASGNPFDKVVGMIEDLLAKLKEEAASEADHKAFCDKELHKNKNKRDKKTAEVDGLTAEIEQKKASIMDMAKRISTLAEEQAELRQVVSDATKQRGEEKSENEVAMKDAAAAQVAVQSALAVLKDFYSKQGGSFLQQVPEMEAYSGMGAASGGVIGMLEVIESDFARVEADTRASETQAAAEYKSLMSESEATLKSKHDAEFKLGMQKDTAEFEQEQLEKNLAASSKQLAMANSYYAELKPQCIEVHVSFEERAQMRQDEIKALKQAYKILDAK